MPLDAATDLITDERDGRSASELDAAVETESFAGNH